MFVIGIVRKRARSRGSSRGRDRGIRGDVTHGEWLADSATIAAIAKEGPAATRFSRCRRRAAARVSCTGSPPSTIFLVWVSRQTGDPSHSCAGAGRLLPDLPDAANGRDARPSDDGSVAQDPTGLVA